MSDFKVSDVYILRLLQAGDFDQALAMEAKYTAKREYTAEPSDGKSGWFVAAGETGMLYDVMDSEREARILALWHSLDDDIEYDDIHGLLVREVEITPPVDALRKRVAELEAALKTVDTLVDNAPMFHEDMLEIREVISRALKGKAK